MAYLPSPPDQPDLGCFTCGDIPVVPSGARRAGVAWKLVQFPTGCGDETGGVDKDLFQPQTPTSETVRCAGPPAPACGSWRPVAVPLAGGRGDRAWHRRWPRPG